MIVSVPVTHFSNEHLPPLEIKSCGTLITIFNPRKVTKKSEKSIGNERKRGVEKATGLVYQKAHHSFSHRTAEGVALMLGPSRATINSRADREQGTIKLGFQRRRTKALGVLDEERKWKHR